MARARLGVLLILLLSFLATRCGVGEFSGFVSSISESGDEFSGSTLSSEWSENFDVAAGIIDQETYPGELLVEPDYVTDTHGWWQTDKGWAAIKTIRAEHNFVVWSRIRIGSSAGSGGPYDWTVVPGGAYPESGSAGILIRRPGSDYDYINHAMGRFVAPDTTGTQTMWTFESTGQSRNFRDAVDVAGKEVILVICRIGDDYWSFRKIFDGTPEWEAVHSPSSTTNGSAPLSEEDYKLTRSDLVENNEVEVGIHVDEYQSNSNAAARFDYFRVALVGEYEDCIPRVELEED